MDDGTLFACNISGLDPDTPGQTQRIATKALRHKEELFFIFELRVFVSLCLGGENILLDKYRGKKETKTESRIQENALP
jgi:hypothetical protein